jgi:hypothetical protein
MILVAAYYLVPVYGIVVIGIIWLGLQTVVAIYSIISLRRFNKALVSVK